MRQLAADTRRGSVFLIGSRQAAAPGHVARITCRPRVERCPCHPTATVPAGAHGINAGRRILRRDVVLRPAVDRNRERASASGSADRSCRTERYCRSVPCCPSPSDSSRSWRAAPLPPDTAARSGAGWRMPNLPRQSSYRSPVTCDGVGIVQLAYCPLSQTSRYRAVWFVKRPFGEFGNPVRKAEQAPARLRSGARSGNLPTADEPNG